MCTQESQIEKLRALQKATNEAIEYVKEKAKNDEINLRDEAVNWGDLSCVLARFCINQFGHSNYEVLIEEGSPTGCDAFCETIRGRLISTFGELVEVRTEW